MVFRVKHSITGLATYVPGINRLILRGTGGTDTARYCYTVWLRHLVRLRRAGLAGIPAVVAELGPGDSIGIGLAALLSGADRYHALDVVPRAFSSRNLEIFDELATLFRARTPIPGNPEFPRVLPPADDEAFPFGGVELERSLAPARVAALRDELAQGGGRAIRYVAPWSDAGVVEPNSVDLLYSQAVLEHVNDLAATYDAMRRWTRPGAWVSHSIDFKCHGMDPRWNAHWACSDAEWRLIRGNRPYLLNREPCATHLAMLAAHGFTVHDVIREKMPSAIERRQLSRRFAAISDEDLATSGVFVAAQRTGD